jgi:hypothetical protein
MAEKFVGGVDTPTNLRFEADKFVDTSNRWESAPKDAAALADATGTLALNQVQTLFTDEANNQKDYYTSARALKQGMFEAATREDDDAVNEYGRKLQDLKVAEKQGLISGTNSQVRQESLLKQTINRYPHREEKIRQMYSSTRARAAAEKEQFKDPQEEGIDALIQRSFSAGRNPAQQLSYERAIENFDLQKKQFDSRVMLGQDIQQDFGAMVDKEFTTVAYDGVMQWLDAAAGMFKTNPKMTIEEAQGGYEQVKAQILLSYDKNVAQLLRQSGNPDAVLNRDFVMSKRKQVEDMMDGVGKKISSMDELEKKKRMMEWGKQLGYEKLMKYDPLIAWMVTANPEKGAALAFNDWDKAQQVIRTQGVEKWNVLINQAHGSDKSIMQFQRDMITGWDGQSQSTYWQSIAGNGTPPESTGFPMVDATRVGAVVSTTLNSPNATPEMKSNAAQASLKAERQYSEPGEYLGPSSVNYKDPGLRKALREDKEFQNLMDTEIESSAASILNKMSGKEEMQAIQFAPQMEREGRDPEKAYPTGGPFTSEVGVKENASANARMGRTMGATSQSWDLASSKQYVDALNKMYWIKRTMYGPATAEDWASTVVSEAQAAADEIIKAEETAKKKEVKG